VWLFFITNPLSLGGTLEKFLTLAGDFYRIGRFELFDLNASGFVIEKSMGVFGPSHSF
jgi:hypothetical protein